MYFGRKILIVFSFIVVHLSAFSQDVCPLTFTGKIVSETNDPLIGAFVMISPDSVSKVAGIDGTFRFENLCPRIYTVTVEFLGYKTKTITITINRNIDQVIALE